MTIDRMASVLGMLLFAVVSWLSARTLDKLEAVSEQVHALSMSLQQVPALSASVHDLTIAVQEHDRRLTIVETIADRNSRR